MYDFVKDATILVTKTDGTTLVGQFVSVNSKGVNIKVDGKVKSVSEARIAEARPVDAPSSPAGLFVDGQTYTTAELAAALDMTARALRVQLRVMGVGVGQGTRYEFDADEANRVVNILRSA